MKKFIMLLTVLVSLLLFTAGTSYAQGWVFNGNDLNNTNIGKVGIGNGGALWAPSEKLHVNTFGASIAGIMAENSLLASANGAIGYFRIKNTASNYMFNCVLRKVAGNHEMLQSCYDGSVNLWREFIYFNFATRKYEMRAGVMDAEFLNSGKFLISSVGNTGIGVINPLEKLEVNGAVRLGGTANNNAGTIQFNGANFLGYDGANWLQLDNVVQAPTWIMIPNPMPAPQNNPQLYPVLPPSTVTTALPGMPNNSAWIYSTDIAAPGLYPHQLTLEAMSIPGGVSASQLYEISQAPLQPLINFSAGINNVDMTYKVNFGPILVSTTQSDGSSVLRAFPNGIIDLPNQSRVRAYQFGTPVQTVPPSAWTPVNFNVETPLPNGWDEQNEFTLAPNPGIPVPPEQAYFTAMQEGYYQVNARCSFELPTGPGPLVAGSYVSIAIWTGPGPGATASYAIGNNLAIAYLNAGQYYPLTNNNAPNVSDVVYLMPGQIISIRVWQSSLIPLNLSQGSNGCYVSIHKVS